MLAEAEKDALAHELALVEELRDAVAKAEAEGVEGGEKVGLAEALEEEEGGCENVPEGVELGVISGVKVSKGALGVKPGELDTQTEEVGEELPPLALGVDPALCEAAELTEATSLRVPRKEREGLPDAVPGGSAVAVFCQETLALRLLLALGLPLARGLEELLGVALVLAVLKNGVLEELTLDVDEGEEGGEEVALALARGVELVVGESEGGLGVGEGDKEKLVVSERMEEGVVEALGGAFVAVDFPLGESVELEEKEGEGVEEGVGEPVRLLRLLLDPSGAEGEESEVMLWKELGESGALGDSAADAVGRGVEESEGAPVRVGEMLTEVEPLGQLVGLRLARGLLVVLLQEVGEGLLCGERVALEQAEEEAVEEGEEALERVERDVPDLRAVSDSAAEGEAEEESDGIAEGDVV
jgi:hypothetical protein